MRPYLLLLGLLLQLNSSLNANSIFDLIASQHEVRELTLELPLDSILAKTGNDQLAELEFTDDTGLVQRWSLNVGVRGKFRRRTCTLPPLKLNFSKSALEAAGLSRHDKLKLVVPCQDDPSAESLILREYLAYQLYEQLTPYHFRTQLLRLTLRDSDQQLEDRTVYAFVLEDTDEMAARIGGVEVGQMVNQPPSSWDRNAEVLHSLLQYLIGNHDFSLTMVRNLKQVKLAHSGKLVPVAYDFDFSLLVHAPYATINNSVGQERFSDRVYLGFNVDDETLQTGLERIDSKRREVLRWLRTSSLYNLDEEFYLTEQLVTGFNRLRRLQRNRSSDLSLYTRLRGKHYGTLPIGEVPENFGISRR